MKNVKHLLNYAVTLSTIPLHKDLIIFDCYSTLINWDIGKSGKSGWVLRPGLEDLVEWLFDRDIVIASDASEERVKCSLMSADIEKYLFPIPKVYGEDNLVVPEKCLGGRYLKNLGKICSDYGVDASNSIMIGDNNNYVDELSAAEYKMEFIYIPSDDKDFSFRNLIPRILKPKK